MKGSTEVIEHYFREILGSLSETEIVTNYLLIAKANQVEASIRGFYESA